MQSLCYWSCYVDAGTTNSMTFTRRLQITNRVINIRPLVRLAARFVGSGPNRLRMVKLSHALREDVGSVGRR